MINPRISVIIPVYNVEKYIEECLNSILDQSYKAFEIIVVNDVTPDNSIAICEKILKGQKDIAWKIVHREKNGGLSAARNSGISESTGEYLCFVDSDDWIHVDMLKLLIEEAECQNAEMVCCNYTLEYKDKSLNSPHSVSKVSTFFSEKDLDELFTMKHMLFIACGRIFKRRLFLENDIWFPVGVYYEDVPTVLDLIICSEKIALIPQYLYHYRQRAGSIMTNMNKKSVMDRFKLLDNIETVLTSRGVNEIKSYEVFKAYGYWVILNHLLQTKVMEPSENYEIAKKTSGKLAFQIKKVFNDVSKVEALKLKIKSRFIFYYSNTLYNLLRRMTRLKKEKQETYLFE